MIGKVLVIGATGLLGRPATYALARRPGGVRALVRSLSVAKVTLPDVELVQGDVRDPDSLRRAMEGCEGAHISLRARSLEEMAAVEIGGALAVAEAASEVGLKRLTYLSGAGLRAELADDPFVDAKLRAEAAIKQGPVPYTILRATHFMESLSMFVRGGRADVIGRQTARYHYLAAEDYARMVAAAFDTPAAANTTFDLFGPDAFTMHEALKVYADAVQPDLKIGTFPLPIARAVAFLRGDAGLRHATRLFASFQRIGESGDPAPAWALLGRPTTTLQAWCAQAPAAR